MGLLSFDNYQNNGKKTKKIVKESRSQKRKAKKLGGSKPELKENKAVEETPLFKKLSNRIGEKNIKSRKPISQPKEINENSFVVGDDYKVKMTIDVPTSLGKEYIEKVQQETGKSALDNFSEAELAEQMIDYLVKQNLTIDNIPASVAVGEDAISDTEPEIAEGDAETVDAETTTEPGETDPDGMAGVSDADIEFEEADEDEEFEDETLEDDSEDEGTEEDVSDIEFEAEESDIESDEIEVEEGEESIHNLYEKIGYGKKTEDKK